MRLRRIALTLAVIVACSLAAASPWARHLGGTGTDLLLWLRTKVAAPAESQPAHVAIIAIDERSFRTAPFQGVPRVLWSPQIAEVMEAVLDAGPSVIGWDIVFPTSAAAFLADNRHDLPLLKQLVGERESGRIVLGAAQLGDEPIVPFERMRWAAGHSRNIRSLNLHTDTDGIVRAVPLFIDRQAADGTVREPAFALEIAARHLGMRPEHHNATHVRLGDFTFPPVAGNAMRLNFAGAPGALPTYSFADMWHCAREDRTDFFRQAFAGRVVLLGTVLDVEDRVVSSGRLITRPDGEGWPSPCTSNLARRDTTALVARNTVPGVYLQATAINNMLDRNPLNPLGVPLRLAVIALVTAFVALVVLRLHPVAAGAAAIGIGVAWTTTATVLLANHIEAPLMEPLASGAVAFAILFAYRVAVVDRDKRHIRRAFSYYVAPSLLDRMVESGHMPALGGEERDITVLFADIANFTPLAEQTGPQELVGILNAYFAGVTEIIEGHLGFVEHYLGDGVLALFGAPVDDPDHRANATRAALALQAQIERLRGTIALPAGHELASRIGINSGSMVVGNVGSKSRFNYTVIGDAVNLAARLEGANKVYGTRTIVSDSTADGAGPGLVFRELDTIRVVGRVQPVRIFEPVGTSDQISPGTRSLVDSYEAGLRAYRTRDFAGALSILKPIADTDAAASVLAARAEHFASNPPPQDWDGVFIMDAK